MENIKELRNKLGIVKKPEIMAETLCSLLRFVIGNKQEKAAADSPKATDWDSVKD
ncbi:MAG: hypothetical protein OIN90_00425 [Candidatus Methanoperedens sp.]|uniref:hypothetical protein n=1 Tax=Candidatus Methanoperedens sp. BLZ2 TaxID=2035255 RepID=UPI0015966642|nr:hypothetical protein [Candidatus Methanoperedens sp. BLZ2]MBZ0175155.1 hypothetical protein [Candidatus Methanoperedens nitroreducens]MCX9078719.1 hypothetical protein [Candidatus Methanoperedens sp.]MCX9086015.1 hypothetical protein [Candidatus Methanoperedens sp.]